MVLKSDPHPWLEPLARRVGVTAFIVLWLAFEIWTEPGSLWFWLSMAALGWAVWDFFLSGNYRERQS